MKHKDIIYTIGHSTKSIDDFIAILKIYGINEVVDVRSIPKSRHNPQFNGPDLGRALRNHHVGYRHQKNLGGLRKPHVDSINRAWRNNSFRGFADYMQTENFQAGLEEILKIAKTKSVVIMCAEAVPWRCHRSLIGDALLMRHFDVQDVYSATTCKPHRLTPWAKIGKDTIYYPEMI